MVDGIDKLGMDYSPIQTIFRVWAPERERIDVLLYENNISDIRKVYSMEKQLSGVHEATIKGDLKDKYYNYLVEGLYEITDPYSIACSPNSKKSAIIDMHTTNPKGWESHSIPSQTPITKEIIYELHVKDFTIDPSSGANHRGKFLGLCEENTNYNGLSTGIDHLKDLGVTCVHLMPVYDFITVNEEEEHFYDDDNYNWGYDPELYNVPEGSYGTNPLDPKSRIIELKTMIMKLHEANIKVVLDVVYNHTYKAEDSNFNILYPNYYYRRKEDGSFSNGSGCGNEIATERSMVRKFILDSLKFWLKEYKVDGFRFDLMALMDIDTMREVVNQLREIKEDIIIYGEPWAGGPTVLPEDMMTKKGTQGELKIAIFNDGFRDAIKGDNDGFSKGFSQGNGDCKSATEKGIMSGYFNSPDESINYINAHDNLIIYDKMKKTFPLSSNEEITLYNKFALGILLLSQGIPFIHAGNEFLRSKGMDHNSYKSPISINGIDWSFKEKNFNFYKYVRDLIALRKKYDEFTLSTPEDIGVKVKFFSIKEDNNLICYTIKRDAKDEYLLIFHNGNNEEIDVQISNIKTHIEYSYNTKMKNINLTELFNHDGIVAEKEIKLEKINITQYSNYIYKIKAV